MIDNIGKLKKAYYSCNIVHNCGNCPYVKSKDCSEDILKDIVEPVQEKENIDPCTTCDDMSSALCDQMNMGKCPEKKNYDARRYKDV